jgi:hypothetical protein
MPREENSQEVNTDQLSDLLSRLRVQLRDKKDELDVISWAIRSIENDLAKIQEEDGVANEKNA